MVWAEVEGVWVDGGIMVLWYVGHEINVDNVDIGRVGLGSVLRLCTTSILRLINQRRPCLEDSAVTRDSHTVTSL
jgi:hypothetical protein